MCKRFKKVMIWLSLLISFGSATVTAQLLQDTATLRLVKKDINYIYNFQFDKAHKVYEEIINVYPEHPIVFLLKGMMIYWENFPLLHTSFSHVSFENDMNECIRLSELNDKSDTDPEYLLADLCARGMLLMFYADNELIMEVTPLTISTYKHLKRAFAFTSSCTDLYYFTGIYKYYREEYPKVYPVYKSLAFLFPRGDMVTGLKELKTAARSSIVLKAESLFLLSWIYLGLENNLSESLNYSRILYTEYPQNELYMDTYLRNLLLVKNYNEAEKILSDSSLDTGNKYFHGQFIILKGILQEKLYHNNKLALQYYNQGITELSLYGDYGDEYAAYAYFGLSRISDDNGEKHSRKTYRKEAMKLAEFKKITFDR
jgi:hypothetical protein